MASRAASKIPGKGHVRETVRCSSVSREKRGEKMRILRIAARTIAAALLVAGLTVPFGTALAQSRHPLNFKSVVVALPGVTSTAALGIIAEGDIVGGYAVGSVGHGYSLSDGTYTTIDDPKDIGRAQQSLTSFDVPGAVVTRPFGISPSGNIVGLYITADGR